MRRRQVALMLTGDEILLLLDAVGDKVLALQDEMSAAEHPAARDRRSLHERRAVWERSRDLFRLTKALGRRLTEAYYDYYLRRLEWCELRGGYTDEEIAKAQSEQNGQSE